MRNYLLQQERYPKKESQVKSVATTVTERGKLLSNRGRRSRSPLASGENPCRRCGFGMRQGLIG
jgi:hypothetical protein